MGHKIIEENAYKFCFIKLKILTEQKPVKRKGFFLILFTTGINVKKKKKSPKVSLRNLSCIYFIKKIVSKMSFFVGLFIAGSNPGKQIASGGVCHFKPFQLRRVLCFVKIFLVSFWSFTI